MGFRFVYCSAFVLSILFFSCTSITEYEKQIHKIRTQKDINLVSKGVIPADALKDFKGLQYFPVNQKFRLMTKLERETSYPVKFATNTDRSPIYYFIGKVFCNIENQEETLAIYATDSLGAEEIFIPFKDPSNNKETYGAGRYIETQLSKGDSIPLDFNLAFNPYCHYNSEYSCPIVPSENTLKSKIEAGEMKLIPSKHD